MTIRLFDAGGAEAFRARLNEDAEFRLKARDMALSLAIDTGAGSRLLSIRDGVLRSVHGFVPLTEPVDIVLKGSEDFWAKLLSPVPPPRFQNLYAGVRAGTCEAIGNGELYAAYFPALTRLIDVLREIENSQASR